MISVNNSNAEAGQTMLQDGAVLQGKNPNAKKKITGLRLLNLKKYIIGYTFIVPFFILFAVFIVIPIIWGFGISLTSYDVVNPMKWIGLSNYVNLVTNDSLFLIALQNTLYFAVIAGPSGFVASFFFAWVINQLKFRNGFSLAFYVPSIVSGLALSIVWLTLFSSNRLGYVNSLLFKLGLITAPLGFTINPTYIVPLIIGIYLWMSLGAGFLANLAGLASVNPEIYEAGRIDGIRNRFQELFLLTIPQMKPQLLFNAIMAIVGSLGGGVAGLATAITGSSVTPDNCALTLVAHMGDYGFTRLELGYASAISFVLLIISYVLGQVVFKIFAEKD